MVNNDSRDEWIWDIESFISERALSGDLERDGMQPTWQDIVELIQQYKVTKTEYWLNENLFTFGWWLLLITSTGLLIGWLIILEKQRIFEIITYGLIVTTIVIQADIIGLYMLLWEYPNALTPIPPITEIHTLQMPIIYMIVYQYFKTWKSFLIATAINAMVFALIFEPLLVWLNIYELNSWKHIYSVVPYIIIAVGVKWIINKFKQLDQNYQ